MTAPSSIDPTRFLHEQLGQASPDLLRSMLTTFMNTLMSAEADAVCGAPYGESSPESGRRICAINAACRLQNSETVVPWGASLRPKIA